MCPEEAAARRALEAEEPLECITMLAACAMAMGAL